MRIILAAAMAVSIGVARAQCPTCNDLVLHPQTGAVTIGPAIDDNINITCGDRPRHYTVAEIDRMRSAIRELLTTTGHCTSTPNTACFTTWNDYPTDAIVESRLQTYIAAGISPDELLPIR